MVRDLTILTVVMSSRIFDRTQCIARLLRVVVTSDRFSFSAIRLSTTVWLAIAFAFPLQAATLHVPQDHETIQAAIDAAVSGDTIAVASGIYRERIRLQAGIRLLSEGDDTLGVDCLKRAEATIIDGGNDGSQPGVVMAEGSTLDGFTITNVGAYDDSLWQKHFKSQGDELGDEEGSMHAEGTNPAISIRSVNCCVSNCIVHHNGDVGIGLLGNTPNSSATLINSNLVYRNMGGGIGVAEAAEPIIRGNICKENLRAGIGCRMSNPYVTRNKCFENIRAGIGCREGSRAIIRGNECYQNRRAGIGVRMGGTAPIIEGNRCYKNEMAGIGCRDEASPLLRGNFCHDNKAAGIGCRDRAAPLIVDNECRENEQAGIGLQTKATATILRNRCIENKLVAIGVTEESVATINDNELSRTAGAPPIIAVKERSKATICNNKILGGGVAAVLVQGDVTIRGNSFLGSGEKQGNAVWVWENSKATIADNTFASYKAAVTASKATVCIYGNSVLQFRGSAFVVRDSQNPAHVFGNTATSGAPDAKLVELQGPSGIVHDNQLKSE